MMLSYESVAVLACLLAHPLPVVTVPVGSDSQHVVDAIAARPDSNPLDVNLNRKQRAADIHPINDVVLPGDLTLRLPPLKSDQINMPAHLHQHHKVVKQMAINNHFDEKDLKKLEEMLHSHMQEYKAAVKRVHNYKENKAKMTPNGQKHEEHKISEQAKTLHHKFYRIKMLAINGGHPIKPFDDLREILKSDEFTEEEREAFEIEIREHLKMKADYAKLNKSRHLSLKKKMTVAGVPHPMYEAHRKKIKMHVVNHQQDMHNRFQDIKKRIYIKAGRETDDL